jgi:nucleotide-binding universal stress UspA family protein
VAYDGSSESEDALATGVDIALLAGATLQSYTVVEPVATGPAVAVPGWGVALDDPGRRHARAEATAERARNLVPEAILDGAEVLVGRASDALAARTPEFDLLVCGSRGYGAVRAVLLGSCSRALVDRAACPVLVLPRRPGARLTVLDHAHRAAPRGSA